MPIARARRIPTHPARNPEEARDRPASRAEEERATLGRRLLGERLRAERTAHSLTLRTLSARSGLSTHMLVSVETGRRLPSLATLDALAVVYDTTVYNLLDGIYPWSSTAPPPH